MIYPPTVIESGSNYRRGLEYESKSGSNYSIRIEYLGRFLELLSLLTLHLLRRHLGERKSSYAEGLVIINLAQRRPGAARCSRRRKWSQRLN